MKLVSYFQKWATFQKTFVLTSLNWFDCAKIMMFVDIWNKQTALFFPKMPIYSDLFLSFYFCRFLPIASGNGRLICRLPAAKEITGKTPCLGPVLRQS